MKEFWTTIQLIFTAVGGWLGWFLGGCDGLLYALLAFVTIDYITGVINNRGRRNTQLVQESESLPTERAPPSFRFRLTTDTLGFGYDLPAAGRS